MRLASSDRTIPILTRLHNPLHFTLTQQVKVLCLTDLTCACWGSVCRVWLTCVGYRGCRRGCSSAPQSASPAALARAPPRPPDTRARTPNPNLLFHCLTVANLCSDLITKFRENTCLKPHVYGHNYLANIFKSANIPFLWFFSLNIKFWLKTFLS